MRLWPDKVHTICEITTEYVINALKLIETVMGKITKLTIADHCTTFMSVTQAQEFWVPFVQRVNKAFNGALRIYHNEGHILHLVHLIPAAGFDAFQVGPETNLSEIRTIVGNNLALFGNIDPVYTFPSGSPQEVREACVQAIMRGGVDGGFLLSTGGGPPRSGAPVQNIDLWKEHLNASILYSQKLLESKTILYKRLNLLITDLFHTLFQSKFDVFDDIINMFQSYRYTN